MIARQRGTSLPEVLTVTVIIGMLLSAMVVIVPLLVKAPVQMQSQLDNVNTAAIALYRVRRDFAEGDTEGVFGCTTTPSVSCNSMSVAPASVQALVVITAENSSGAFQVDNNGFPNWQGFYIYWLVANGTSYDMMRAWEGPSAWGATTIGSTNGIPNVDNTMASAAVTAAMAISPPPVLTNYISSMQLGTNSTTSTVNFELVAGTTGGTNQTQTTFQSNTYARN